MSEMDAPGERIQTEDGRRLAYAERGPEDGRPVLFFHGNPGSRLFHHPDKSILADLDVRLVTIDRPGFGWSTRHPGRTLRGWAHDAATVADELEIDQFHVAGLSAGGPHALSCAAGIPERVHRAAVISGAGPLDAPRASQERALSLRALYLIARHAPGILPRLLRMSDPGADPEKTLDMTMRQLPEADREILKITEIRTILETDFREGTRNGVDGMAQDMIVLASRWSDMLGEVGTGVHLWQGTADTFAPPPMGEYMAERIPNCRAEFLDGEGHFSLFVHHWRTILGDLLSEPV